LLSTERRSAGVSHALRFGRAIRDGGGFGSIIGRNSFQRPKEHALKFLERIMKIYAVETT
jgi:DhnA family fructose-bisphosphate aldolase class Ia